MRENGEACGGAGGDNSPPIPTWRTLMSIPLPGRGGRSATSSIRQSPPPLRGGGVAAGAERGSRGGGPKNPIGAMKHENLDCNDRK